jgi:hypothetical protein
MNAMVQLGAFGAGGPCLGSVLATRTLVEYLIYGGALLLVAGIIFFWAFAIRKPRKRKRRHRHGSEQRNPTLAETGGLPPIKTDSASRPENPSR